jgi:hypothetical protein
MPKPVKIILKWGKGIRKSNKGFLYHNMLYLSVKISQLSPSAQLICTYKKELNLLYSLIPPRPLILYFLLH